MNWHEMEASNWFKNAMNHSKAGRNWRTHTAGAQWPSDTAADEEDASAAQISCKNSRQKPSGVADLAREGAQGLLRDHIGLQHAADERLELLHRLAMQWCHNSGSAEHQLAPDPKHAISRDARIGPSGKSKLRMRNMSTMKALTRSRCLIAPAMVKMGSSTYPSAVSSFLRNSAIVSLMTKAKNLHQLNGAPRMPWANRLYT